LLERDGDNEHTFVVKTKKKTQFSQAKLRVCFSTFLFLSRKTAATVSLLFFFGPQFAAENENLNF